MGAETENNADRLGSPVLVRDCPFWRLQKERKAYCYEKNSSDVRRKGEEGFRNG